MSNLTIPLGIDSLKIIAQTVDAKGNFIINVESTATSTPCHKCGQLATKMSGYGETIMVQHLSILDRPVYLRITKVRYECDFCEDHPKTSEQYDWCDRKSKTTKGLDNYINRCVINSTIEDVAKKIGISCEIVESSLNRCVSTTVEWSQYTDLETLGIDEIALKKGHNEYVVIISAKDNLGELSVVAVLPNRLKATVKAFLESIPDHLKKTVKNVCTDMYDGFVNAATEVFGSRVVVVDRYHVAKLYREPLDELRISEMKRLKVTLPHEEYAKLENMMWIIRKKHECLTKQEKSILEFMYKYSPKLKEAHKLALRLTQIFNTHQNRKRALSKLNRWIARVQSSTTSCFNKFIKTLNKYKVCILNYFKSRKNSGFVEGLNSKIKVLKRRCYGISNPKTLFQRLFLDLKGFSVFA